MRGTQSLLPMAIMAGELEALLGVAGSVVVESPAGSSLQTAWAAVRTASQSDILPALSLLCRYRRVLFISEADCWALLRLLEKSDITSDILDDRKTPAAIIGSSVSNSAVVECCFLLLSTWFRRPSARARIHTPAWQSVDSTAEAAMKSVAKKLLSGPCTPSAWLGAGILCLGSICAAERYPLATRNGAQELLLQAIQDVSWGAVMEGVREALAGVGHAISVCGQKEAVQLLESLLCMWGKLPELPSLTQGPLLSRLMAHEGELLRASEDRSRAFSVLQGLVTVSQKAVKGQLIKDSRDPRETTAVSVASRCAGVMAVAGLLRGLHVQPDQAKIVWWWKATKTLEDLLSLAAANANPWECTSQLEEHGFYDGPIMKKSLSWVPPVPGQLFFGMPASLTWTSAVDLWQSERMTERERVREVRHWLRCVSMAVSSLYGAGGPGVPQNPAVLCCLLASLWADAVQLAPFYASVLAPVEVFGTKTSPPGQGLSPDFQATSYSTPGVEFRDNSSRVSDWLQNHVEGPLFKEAGALTRALSEQVRGANLEIRFWASKMACHFAKATHQSHRYFYMEAVRGNFVPHVSESIMAVDSKAEQTGIIAGPALSKALTASFLSVCMFFASILLEDLPVGNALIEDKQAEEMRQGKLQFAVNALEALAFMDFTAISVVSYGKLVQKAVEMIGDSQLAVEAAVARIPLHEDVISGPGWEVDTWQLDTVCTSCIYFWLRVLPLWLPNLQPSRFAESMASTLFLYLRHPRSDVVMACHSLFALFLKESAQTVQSHASSGAHVEAAHGGGGSHMDSERWLVLEQLSVHYTREALRNYPTSTPFEGFLSGIVSISLYLPAGSPACAICLRLVRERSLSLLIGQQQKPSTGSVRLEGSFAEVAEKTNTIGRRKNREAAGKDDTVHCEEEAGGKLRSLLMAVIPIVDLQTLAVCLQETARLLLQLSSEGQSQEKALAELYEVLAASDDYTRKPFTVPFFQSLSYLCAVREQQQRSPHTGQSASPSSGSGRLNKSRSRL